MSIYDELDNLKPRRVDFNIRNLTQNFQNLIIFWSFVVWHCSTNKVIHMRVTKYKHKHARTLDKKKHICVGLKLYNILRFLHLKMTRKMRVALCGNVRVHLRLVCKFGASVQFLSPKVSTSTKLNTTVVTGLPHSRQHFSWIRRVTNIDRTNLSHLLPWLGVHEVASFSL